MQRLGLVLHCDLQVPLPLWQMGLITILFTDPVNGSVNEGRDCVDGATHNCSESKISLNPAGRKNPEGRFTGRGLGNLTMCHGIPYIWE